ncbi:hypothetical protein ElyMa_004026700 [Elysia marginata]|uniref:Uncharacterized protein n=1 Tax=Elysia marginata TaxID=1093978 RepID=A0AAV4G256_9GAST|nr:hypothetical protein ElyMa_004026700 [Elysia marginata]
MIDGVAGPDDRTGLVEIWFWLSLLLVVRAMRSDEPGALSISDCQAMPTSLQSHSTSIACNSTTTEYLYGGNTTEYLYEGHTSEYLYVGNTTEYLYGDQYSLHHYQARTNQPLQPGLGRCWVIPKHRILDMCSSDLEFFTGPYSRSYSAPVPCANHKPIARLKPVVPQGRTHSSGPDGGSLQNQDLNPHPTPPYPYLSPRLIHNPDPPLAPPQG